MREEINQFLIKENKSGLSEGTLKKYEMDLNLFYKFIDYKENIKSIMTLDDDRLQIIINKYIIIGCKIRFFFGYLQIF